jgi:5-methylcytosine-specific restriction endonuclease McrA
MATEIISREEARAQGLKRYFSGEPCRNDHLAERYVCDTRCVKCELKQKRKRRATNPEWFREYYAANAERKSKQRRERHAANPDRLREWAREYYTTNRQRRCEHSRKYYAANAAKAREYASEYRAANPEKIRENNAAYYAANPEKFVVYGSKRRARIIDAGGTHTPADLKRIYEHQGGKCALCKCLLSKVRAEVDHIVPLARGGHNGPSNLQYLCRPCNRAKSTKDPIEFAQERGLLL